MRDFFKRMLASFLGVLIGGFVFFVFSLFLFSIIISQVQSWPTRPIEDNSVLVMSLNGPLVEGTAEDYRNFLSGLTEQRNHPIGVYEVLEALKVAKTDDQIQGLYLPLENVQGGWSTARTIREAIIDFKESGKPVVAYFETPNMKSYYIGSAASEVFIYNESGIEFSGFSSVQPFFKGLFEKLGVEPRIFQVGTHKGVAEPFIRKDLSPENKEQISNIIAKNWEVFVKDIEASRAGMPIDLKSIPQDEPILSAERATQLGLFDGMSDEMGAIDTFAFLAGEKWEDKKKKFVSIHRYLRSETLIAARSKEAKDRIAVLFLEGDVVTGQGRSNESIGSDDVVSRLRDLYDREDIKGIVLRVNSGGGSALASDIIWRKLDDRPEKMPLVSSISDMAASGAYYFIASSDHIFAEPTSITGSIGVIGILFDFHQLLNSKLGMNFDVVKTHPYADIGSSLRPLHTKESEEIQKSVEQIYKQFVRVVQEGREFEDEATVDRVAQGRIFSGEVAATINLVDELGGLEKAIEKAAELANVKDYQVEVVSLYPNDFEALLTSIINPLAQVFAPTWYEQRELGRHFQEYKSKLERNRGLLMKMPFEFEASSSLLY